MLSAVIRPNASSTPFRMRLGRLLLVAATALGALALPAFSGAQARVYAADVYPESDVYFDDHLLSGEPDASFEYDELDAAGDTQSLMIAVPKGFGVDLVHPAGTKLGAGELDTVKSAGGRVTPVGANLVVMDPTDYAANTTDQTCAPGTHAAVWKLAVGASTTGLTVPIAVDTYKGGYKLTMCFDEVHAGNLELSGLFFQIDGIFRNPSHGGKYLFDSIVTPYAADGTPSTSTAYELRAFEWLPQFLTGVPTYDTSTKTLTVKGSLEAANLPRKAVNVHIMGSPNVRGTSLKEIGVAVTDRSGAYTFTRRMLVPPKYAVALVHTYHYPTCLGGSPAPSGCASYTIDGRYSYITPVLKTKAS